jgi:hypothetical protein
MRAAVSCQFTTPPATKRFFRAAAKGSVDLFFVQLVREFVCLGAATIDDDRAIVVQRIERISAASVAHTLIGSRVLQRRSVRRAAPTSDQPNHGSDRHGSGEQVRVRVKANRQFAAKRRSGASSGGPIQGRNGGLAHRNPRGVRAIARRSRLTGRQSQFRPETIRTAGKARSIATVSSNSAEPMATCPCRSGVGALGDCRPQTGPQNRRYQWPSSPSSSSASSRRRRSR